MRIVQAISISGLLALSATGAFAADLPSKQTNPTALPYVTPYNWSGFYAGINAGVNLVPKKLAFHWVDVPESLAVQKKSNAGFAGGGQIGANYQFGNWVVGIEADLDYVNTSRRLALNGVYPGEEEFVLITTTTNTNSYVPPQAGTNTINLTSPSINNSGTMSGIIIINGVNYGQGVLHGKTFYPSDGSAPHDLDVVNGPSDLTSKTTTSGAFVETAPVNVANAVRIKQRYVGTVRTRFGVAWDKFWFYGTGGLAYGDIDVHAAITRSDGTAYYGSKSSTRVGWTLGAGVEYALTQNITVRGEYLYYDLGKAKASVYGNNAYIGQVKADVTGNIVRAGVNYKFNTF